MVLTPTDALTSRGFYITLRSWIGDTAHLAARLQSENGGLKGAVCAERHGAQRRTHQGKSPRAPEETRSFSSAQGWWKHQT